MQDMEFGIKLKFLLEIKAILWNYANIFEHEFETN